MDDAPLENLLLAALPRDAKERIWPHLHAEDLPIGQTLFPPKGALDRFFFVASGLVSLLYTTSDGDSAEIALVGPEGGIGLRLILGGRPFPAHAVVQAPCRGWSLHADRLREEFARQETLHRNLLRYAQALMTQMAHTAVCNRHHSVEVQLCRWLLLSHDRLDGDELRMTQETIAQMLGVRRAGVNEAATQLQRAGLIQQSRGRIRVLDREGLEARACECYQVIRDDYEQMRVDITAEAEKQASLRSID